MTDKKITELTNITGANLADNDEFVVVDVSADETKAVTREEFFKSITSADINGGTIDGTVIGGTTPAAISGTTGSFSGNVTADGLTVSGSNGTLATLDRVGSNGVYLALTDNSGSNVFLGNSGGQFQVQTAGASYASKLTVESNGDISFYEDTGTTPKFFWDASAESLGIGTSSPTGKLHVSNSYTVPTGGHDSSVHTIISNSGSANNYVGMELSGGNNGGSFIHFGDTDDANVGGLAYFHNGNYMRFDVNASERMRIDSSGSLLVGTTTSAGAGGVGLTGKLKVGYQGNLGGFGLESSSGLFYSGGTSDGFVAINGNGANVPLYIAHTANSTTSTLVSFNDAGTNVGGITTNGTSTSYNTSSDYRLKEDVQPMTGASDRVLALKPVNFEWIADGTRVDGFLAHEAQEVVPEAVTGMKDAVDADGNPEYQGIDQSKLVPLLTAALQEALTKIDALETRITALEG